MNHLAAITGIGCVSGAGVGVAAAHAVLAGSQPVPVSAFAPPANMLEPLIPGLGFPRPARTSLMSLLAAREAWEQCALPETRVSERMGLVMNRNHGQHQIVERYLTKLWDSGPASVSGLQFVQTIANTALGFLAMQFQLRGPSELYFGPSSLGLALDWVRDESVDAVVCGGFDECSDFLLATCAAWGLECQASFRPGDAAAFAVLEREETAMARGQEILGFLSGYASFYDRIGRKRTVIRNAADMTCVIETALRDANLAPTSVDLIIANAGAGLAQTDEAETEAISQVFSNLPPILTPKSVFGETWGAAGHMGLVSALWALSDRQAKNALVLCADFSGQNTAFVIQSAKEAGSV